MDRLQQSIQTRGNGWINGELVGICAIKADVKSYIQQSVQTRGNGWINGELVGISAIKADVKSYTGCPKSKVTITN